MEAVTSAVAVTSVVVVTSAVAASHGADNSLADAGRSVALISPVLRLAARSTITGSIITGLIITGSIITGLIITGLIIMGLITTTMYFSTTRTTIRIITVTTITPPAIHTLLTTTLITATDLTTRLRRAPGFKQELISKKQLVRSDTTARTGIILTTHSSHVDCNQQKENSTP
jgi:hypothetical protein